MVAMTALVPPSTGPSDPAKAPSPAGEGPAAKGAGGFSDLVSEAGRALDDGEVQDRSGTGDGQDSPLNGRSLPSPIAGTASADGTVQAPGPTAAADGGAAADEAAPSADGAGAPGGASVSIDAPPDPGAPGAIDAADDARAIMDGDPMAQGLVAGLSWVGGPTGRPGADIGRGRVGSEADRIAQAIRAPEVGDATPADEGPAVPTTLRRDPFLDRDGQAVPMPVTSVSADAVRPDASRTMAGAQAEVPSIVTAMTDQSGAHSPPIGGLAGGPTAPASTPPVPAAAQTVPQSPMTTAMGQAAWADELGQRVHWFVGQNVQRAEILLHPAHLGTVEVSIVMQHDHVQVSLQSHHAQVREAMESALPRLREQLQDGGGQGSVQVDVSGRDERRNDGAGGPARYTPIAADPENDADSVPSLTTRSVVQGRGLLDHYV